MLITTSWALTQPTPSHFALELVVGMVAVIPPHQNATVIRVGGEHLVQFLYVPRLVP